MFFNKLKEKMNISDMSQFWSTLQVVRELRDKNIKYIEKYFYVMGGLVCILAMILALEGSQLVNHDFVINGRMGFSRVRAGLILFIIFLSFFVFAISMFTIALTAKPQAPALFTMMFGVTTFFFGAIPLIAEGDSILALSRVHNTTLDLMCDLNPRQLREKTNKYTYAMFEMAH